DPARARHAGRGVEGAVPALELRAPRGERAHPLGVEARPHLAREHEARALVHTHEEGAQAHARALAPGEAADDDLLASPALDLEPVAPSSRAVRRVPPLRHRALEAKPASLAPELHAATHHRAPGAHE